MGFKKRGARFWVGIGALALTAGAAALDIVSAGMDMKADFDDSDEELAELEQKSSKEEEE